jgi:hypothetical protein
MKKNYLSYYYCLLFTALLISCKKKKSDAVGSDPPSIEFVSVYPQNIREYKDSVIIKLRYKDPNGDLGDENPDELSLEVKDSRFQKADAFHVRPLAPPSEKNIAIEGELRVKLNSLFLLGGGTVEQTVLAIKLKDRRGNWSNQISTPQLTIIK